MNYQIGSFQMGQRQNVMSTEESAVPFAQYICPKVRYKMKVSFGGSAYTWEY